MKLITDTDFLIKFGEYVKENKEIINKLTSFLNSLTINPNYHNKKNTRYYNNQDKSIKSINKCISLLKKKKNDSILTVNKIYSWFWYKEKPINYLPKVLPRSQDANPIIQETTGLYGITNQALKKYKCRIGKRPIFFNVPRHESLDLDTKEDFLAIKTYAKKYLFY